MIHEGDDVILSVPPYVPEEGDNLHERKITRKDAWCGKTIEELELKDHELIAIVIRGNETIIPDGKTRMEVNDTVVIATL